VSDPSSFDDNIEIPKPPDGWWERVPVLHELYKLLQSTEPVNWELARQVGVALASYDEEIADVQAAQDELDAVTRAASVEAEEFSGLIAGSIAPVTAVTRAQWVEANIESFRILLNPLAQKMSGSGEVAMVPGATQVLQQVSGVFMGLQTGFVMGYLGRAVVGQYEVPIPIAEPKLLYVVSNITQIERDWSLDPKQFRYWIALHEITHHLEFSKPWVQSYFRSQLKTMIDSLDFDPERMQSAFEGLEMLDPDRMAEALGDPDRLIQAAWTPLSEDAVERLQAFMTLAEGYATFVMDAVGARVLTEHARLKEVMERRKHSTSPGEALFERLLGLELKRRQYEEGVKFCRYVAALHDIDTLNHVWDDPESLPTTKELADPDTWIARVIGGSE